MDYFMVSAVLIAITKEVLIIEFYPQDVVKTLKSKWTITMVTILARLEQPEKQSFSVQKLVSGTKTEPYDIKLTC